MFLIKSNCFNLDCDWQKITSGQYPGALSEKYEKYPWEIRPEFKTSHYQFGVLLDFDLQ